MMSYISTVQHLSPCPAEDCELGCLPIAQGFGVWIISYSSLYSLETSITESGTRQTLRCLWKLESWLYHLPALWKSSAPISETYKLNPPTSFLPFLLTTEANSAFESQLHYYLVLIPSWLPEYLPYWLSIFFLCIEIPHLYSPSSAVKHVQNYSNLRKITK